MHLLQFIYKCIELIIKRALLKISQKKLMIQRSELNRSVKLGTISVIRYVYILKKNLSESIITMNKYVDKITNIYVYDTI